jgi:tRNA-splicing ligase RtcB
MGDNAVIVQGAREAPTHADVDLRAAALFSTVHGAGRVMSRTAAAGKVHRKSGTILREGLISEEMMDGWLAERGVVLRGGGLDEAPQAYRRLPQVLAAQQGTIEVLHTLRPLVVVMAGAREWDPYRD